MTERIRPADLSDLEAMAPLLVADARAREALLPGLWPVAGDAGARVTDAIRRALSAEAPPFRQHWLVAEAAGRITGLAHSIRLPVPPIYAGVFGAPGLIMEDCCTPPDAPADLRARLLAAAETDLRQDGAEVLLASSVAGGDWADTMAEAGYAPLTLYLARAGLRAAADGGVRPAREADLPGIVAASARSRAVLHRLDPFWQPHEEAAARFGAWMGKSLTLPDRDMFVSGDGGAVSGYAISNPATPLHFPPAHDITRIGVIDDFHHAEMEDPDALQGDGTGARALLAAAEGALHARGNAAALVVCPAAWTSKRAVLEAEGYETALVWWIRREARA